jgi:hypothetical protein
VLLRLDERGVQVYQRQRGLDPCARYTVQGAASESAHNTITMSALLSGGGHRLEQCVLPFLAASSQLTSKVLALSRSHSARSLPTVFSAALRNLWRWGSTCEHAAAARSVSEGLSHEGLLQGPEEEGTCQRK